MSAVLQWIVYAGTMIGWGMIGSRSCHAWLDWRQRRASFAARVSKATQLERIARLEIACGVGLKYGAEALENVGSRVARPVSVSTLEAHGGAVERVCWACGEEYTPHSHRDWYAERSTFTFSLGYAANPDRDPLDEVLCVACLANARAELDYGVPL